MTDTPYPIVRCTDPVARRALAQTLMDLGFDTGHGVDVIVSDSRPYVCLLPPRSMSLAEDGELRVECLSDKRYWGAPMTLVNSPAQMLAYAKRAKLASVS